MPNINITVANKIATNMSPGQTIVCGNNDYTITFTFDAEWAADIIKTARFVYTRDGKVQYTDFAFTGTVVPVPVLSGIREVYVGVYAGDLHTTTPARVFCGRSILCGGGTHEEPPEDIYNQILALVNSMIGQSDTHTFNTSNPHQVTAAQVGARPDSWMPTAAQVGARPDSWMPTAAQVGAAPAVESSDHPGCYYRVVNGEREWINPPMLLGVEYRTTERFLGRPVYTKAIDFGAMPNTNRKTQSHNIANMVACVGIFGIATSADGFGYYFPLYNNVTSVGQIGSYVNSSNITVTTTADWSAETATITLKYTKTTN